MIEKQYCNHRNPQHPDLVCSGRQCHIGLHSTWSYRHGGTVHWDAAGNLTR